MSIESNGYKSWSGAWKKCPQCGKQYYVNDCQTWVYKRSVSENKDHAKILYFCRYSCMRAYEREYEALKAKRRMERAKKEYERRGGLKSDKEE